MDEDTEENNLRRMTLFNAAIAAIIFNMIFMGCAFIAPDHQGNKVTIDSLDNTESVEPSPQNIPKSRSQCIRCKSLQEYEKQFK